MIPDSQDHLAEVQHQRHQGVGQEQGLPQRAHFWIIGLINVLGIIKDHYKGNFKVLLDSQGHLDEVQHQRHQGVGQKQSYPKQLGCIYALYARS